jgi:hypothetical protein
VARLGRNEACWCGSGKKYKKCHLHADELKGTPAKRETSGPRHIDWKAISQLRDRKVAEEARRESIQGKGKPIISADFKGQKIVAVGNVLHFSPADKTKSFTDFLGNYIRSLLTPEWGNSEIAKPLTQRHPLLQWYDALCALQAKHFKPGELSELPATGLVSAYYSLAYNLYLLQHNAEVQAHLLRRLKNHDAFLSAVYETHVAAWFILAGFNLSIENEDDASSTHVEFTAESPAGAKYSVEAKRRDPLKPHLAIGNQLQKALKKDAKFTRVVCIDLNVRSEAVSDEEAVFAEIAPWIRGKEQTLTINGAPAPSAYVLVTNVNHHLHLDDCASRRVLLADGFKIDDFGTKTHPSLSAAYKARRKHSDMYSIGEAFQRYQIPVTFDGDLPEFAFGHAERRFIVGDRHQMDDGFIGTLEQGVVLEAEKAAYLVYAGDDGRRVIYTSPLSDAELRAYKSHPETFFGKIERVGGQLKSTLDLYSFIYESYQKTPRAKILEWLAKSPDISELEALSDEDLRFVFAERTVIGMIQANPPKDVRFGNEPRPTVRPE